MCVWDAMQRVTMAVAVVTMAVAAREVEVRVIVKATAVVVTAAGIREMKGGERREGVWEGTAAHLPWMAAKAAGCGESSRSTATPAQGDQVSSVGWNASAVKASMETVGRRRLGWGRRK